MTRIITALCAAAALSACATAPEPKVVTKTVFVPTPVACIDKASIPAQPDMVTLPADARSAADLAASQALLLRKWGTELLALMQPCTR
jgi:hypothetical protein